MSRCVVTGHKDGKSIFVADGPASDVITFFATPDMVVTKIWATSASPSISETAAGLRGRSFLPALAETRFCVLKFPPDSVVSRQGFDLAAAAQEFAERLPEMAAVREMADPAMHRTDTIDYLIVLDGEVWLELDDHEEVLLRQHDIVVQSGTRHAWRNKSNRPVTLAVVMVGSARGA
ncbi:MAG TPA: cupin domain-containing protein [Phenylobacterium sp.]|uniref:cupin domain-containing protein n=1 Tax=Phenylobacterium sp. TaxID=1871053 RepID=UPI002B4877D4|nr:cupin domain-containing protein [Phenylobacterium sp.]HKR90211.1 cupin domain-containing protein [Phenylobacterium sp.]